MPSFSQRSKANLNTCHEWLQEILNRAIGDFDFTVICGYRDEAAQNHAYSTGYSKVRYPHSKHNNVPSMAVDIAPYPIAWERRDRFIYLAGWVKGVASIQGYPIIWGGDWNDNTILSDEHFFDLGHFEIREV